MLMSCLQIMLMSCFLDHAMPVYPACFCFVPASSVSEFLLIKSFFFFTCHYAACSSAFWGPVAQSPNRMFPPTMDLADEHQASSMNLFTFLSREAEKTLRRSAGLSVPESAYYGSRLAIPCLGTGPLRCRSPPAPLAAHSGPAVKPSPSSRRKKCRRGAPSCSAGEEVVSLPADLRAAASNPASSSATALSARLAAPPPMPSSLAPARCSEATPDELEQRLRFYARQIKSFRTTSLMYSSPELMERIRQMERDYETAVRQFYCRPPPSSPGLQSSAAAEQPTPGLQEAAATEQPTSGLQPVTPQPDSWPDPKSFSTSSVRGTPRLKASGVSRRLSSCSRL
ncbi:hypothetical protein AMECASPLE_015603 [Ameca splendens]|uniref:Uncharacterized protein n=1 Tax=Ameca splendens TaxID=208324 RepID=A0ABV0ZXS0_9TELE